MGDNMGFYFLAFLIGVLFCYAVITYKEGRTSYSLTQDQEMMKRSIANLRTQIETERNRITVLSGEKKKMYEELQCHKTEATRLMGEYDEELDKIQDHCTKLREQLMVSDTKINMGPKKFIFESAIPIKLIEDPVVKEVKTRKRKQFDPKLVNEVKKQIKEME